MDLCISDKENEEIVNVAFHYYYNPSKWPGKLNTVSVHLCDRIAHEAPNTVMERGIITALSFFLDQKFLISNDNLFPNELQPGVPANWRNNIFITNRGRCHFASYFIRKRNQTFVLNILYDSLTRTVEAKVKHLTVNHKPLVVDFGDAELMGLSDPQYQIAFALHFVTMCAKEWENMVNRAEQDKPPTAQRTPL